MQCAKLGGLQFQFSQHRARCSPQFKQLIVVKVAVIRHNVSLDKVGDRTLAIGYRLSAIGIIGDR